MIDLNSRVSGVAGPTSTPASAKLITLLLVVCVGSLVGCGASLNSDIQNGLVSDGQRVGVTVPAADSGQTPGAHAKKGQLSQTAAAFTAASTPGDTAYKVGLDDVISISVFKVPDLDRNVQVAGSGTVNLPLVGEIRAAGLTVQEIERDLTAKLGTKYLQKPQVTVSVKEYNSQRVTVDGAVKKPGVYPIRGKTSLLQIVAMSGGLTAAASSDDIVVFRQVSGKRSAARFSLDEIRAGSKSDPALQAGDVVIANSSAFKTAFKSFLKALPITSLFLPIL